MVSKFNDGVHARSSNPMPWRRRFFVRMDITSSPFPVNAITPRRMRPRSMQNHGRSQRCAALLENKKFLGPRGRTLSMPSGQQITRHIFVEGWSAIRIWTGTSRLRDFLKCIWPRLPRQILGGGGGGLVPWRRQDGYNSAARMRTALHGATQIFDFFAISRRESCPRAYCFPMKSCADQTASRISELL